MFRLSVLLALCATLAFGTAAFGATGSSFYGPTGLIVMPTADSLDAAEFRIFGNYWAPGGDDIVPVGAAAGLGYGLEVSGTYFSDLGDTDNSTGIVNAKWTMYKGGLVMPAIAVGALNVLDEEDNGFDLAPFAVASKSFTIPDLASVSVHAGYVAGNIESTMFGANMTLNSNVELMADYMPDFSRWSFGARYTTASGLGIQAASIDDEFTAGVFYTRSLGLW